MESLKLSALGRSKERLRKEPGKTLRLQTALHHEEKLFVRIQNLRPEHRERILVLRHPAENERIQALLLQEEVEKTRTHLPREEEGSILIALLQEEAGKIRIRLLKEGKGLILMILRQEEVEKTPILRHPGENEPIRMLLRQEESAKIPTHRLLEENELILTSHLQEESVLTPIPMMNKLIQGMDLASNQFLIFFYYCESVKRQKMMDGTKSGLNTKSEFLAMKPQMGKNSNLQKIIDEAKNAETIYRDKSGKKRDFKKEEELDEAEKARKEEELKNYKVWNKGKKQLERKEENVRDLTQVILFY